MIKCNGRMGKMEQDVAHSRGGCNLRHALESSRGKTSMGHIYIDEGIPVF